MANTWYLQNVIINGANNSVPDNGEIGDNGDVYLNFLTPPYDFQTFACNGLSGSLSFNDVNSSFIVSDLGQTLASCAISANNDFEVLYFGLYWDNYSNPFTYNITSESNISTLIVTAVNGDQAIYGSARLHVEAFKMTDIKTYPNPVINELIVEKQNTTESLNLHVFNMNGQLIMSQSIHRKQMAINVSSLKSGVYFFVFEDTHSRKEIRKIIK
ncbi:hypothetical protein BAA08_11910 [Bizionia sp. APA-3]|nr:hypothetical protein BAA08_11910 [Bizionia sp. APA-3]